MASKAEQISQAVVALYTGTPMDSVAADDIYRDPLEAVEKSTVTALAIEIGDEPAPELFTLSVADRTLELRVTAIAKGKGATTLADAPMVEAHNRLMANLTLGGLADDIEEGPTRRQRDQLDRETAAITKAYRVRYRTAARSLET